MLIVVGWFRQVMAQRSHQAYAFGRRGSIANSEAKLA